MRRLATSMFVLSGAAGLVFEVALQRSLTRAFGVSAFATSTVLAAWMAGLALGAVLFGRAADRSRSPLKLYAGLELGIAGVAVVMPFLVPAVVEGFGSIANGAATNSPALLVGRLVLAFGVTLVPTLLMGGTLPAVARALASKEGEDSTLAGLYTANLVGAVLGAGLTAYLVMPALGLSKTMWLGASLNVLAALIGLWLARGRIEAVVERTEQAAARAPIELLALSAWSGFATFAAEVTWFQLLGVVVGTSVYAFGLMLATFLVGLALGSAWVARAKEVERGLVGRAQIATAAAIALTLPLWDRVPGMFAMAAPFATSFWSRELVRALACVELLLIPAAALGALFPLVLRLSWRASSRGQSLGGLAAVNTIGAVLGSLLTGFVLLPLLGSRGVLVLVVVLSAAIGAWWLQGRQRLIPVAIVAFVAVLPAWNLGRLASGANVYFAQTFFDRAEVIWAHESVASGLTSVVKLGDGLTLLTNGKFQGNDQGEVDAQRAFTQLPMLVQRGWDRALLIGVGTGCSLGVLAAQPFKHVEAAELSSDNLYAAKTYFPHINGNVLSSERVTTHLADGRNLLLLSPHLYDLISIEITSIWFAGATDLYNREFYRLAKKRLAPGGVVQQWVQLHHLTRRDLAVILQSARAELPHVALFLSGGQGIMLASAEPLRIDYAALTSLSDRLRGTEASRGIPGEDLLTLRGKLLLDADGIEALIAEEAMAEGVASVALASTDDSLRLEYSTPRGNADDSLDREVLVASLAKFPPKPLPVEGAADGELLHAHAAWLVGSGKGESALKLVDQLSLWQPSVPLSAWLTASAATPDPSP